MLRRLASWLILLPLLYILSIGPACWLTIRTNVSTSALENFYRPITWAMYVFQCQVLAFASASQWQGNPAQRLVYVITHDSISSLFHIFMNNPTTLGDSPQR
jgi:hypothetical protein